MAIQAMAIHGVLVVTWAIPKCQRLVFYPLNGFILVYLIIGTTVGTRTYESQFYLRPTGVNPFRQFWGWIGNGSRYNVEHLAREYTWIWVGICVSTIAYGVLLYLVDRGATRVSQTCWAKFELQIQGHAQVEGKTRRSVNIIVYVRSDFGESACGLNFFLH
jgi:hypothetical protein